MNIKNIFDALQKTMSGCQAFKVLKINSFCEERQYLGGYKSGHPDMIFQGDNNYFFRVENMATELAPFRGVAKNLWMWIWADKGGLNLVSSSLFYRTLPSYPYSESQASYKSTQKEGDSKVENQQEQNPTEEELREKGRIALIQVETEGKKYFKPQDGVTYRVAFDRATALDVRGQPSAKLTRKILDRSDPQKIIDEVPVLEWAYEITHISGNKQIWSITSKKLAAKILNQLINGKSVLDVTKNRTGSQITDVEYTVVGVS
jgi:hypothetical protein